MSYQVTVTQAEARPTAVVAAATTWPEFPALWKPLLDQVEDWCAGQGLRTAGPRWEIYGPHDDDPANVWTEVHWLLSD
jgi:hypothetical protein